MNDTLFDMEPVCFTCRGSKRVFNVYAGGYSACPSCARVNPVSGVTLKREAIERVDENANPDWKVLALGAVHVIAQQCTTFTTDDVWFGLDAAGATTHEPRAMGAIMTRAAREGWIEATDRTEESERPENHRRPVRVWRSLIYRPTEEVTL